MTDSSIYSIENGSQDQYKCSCIRNVQIISLTVKLSSHTHNFVVCKKTEKNVMYTRAKTEKNTITKTYKEKKRVNVWDCRLWIEHDCEWEQIAKKPLRNWNVSSEMNSALYWLHSSPFVWWNECKEILRNREKITTDCSRVTCTLY